MVNKKGKLRNNDGIVDSSDYIPRLAMPGARDIIETKEESWGHIALGWSKGFIGFILVALIIVAALYSGLAATLMMYSPISSNSSSRVLVVRNTWSKTAGQPPLNTNVVISSTTALPSEWWNRVAVGWTGIANPAIVKISSTDYEKLYIANSKVTGLTSKLNGNFTGSADFKYDPTAKAQNYQLKNEYLVQCVSGNCKPGTYSIISNSQIYGVTKAKQ